MNMTALRNMTGMLTIGVGLTIGAAIGGEASGHPLLGPSLYAPTESSVHVWWHTAEEHATHAVQFGENPQMLTEIELTRKTRYPTLRLERLVPGRLYHYRINSGPHTGQFHSFTLPDPKAPFRIGFWSDNQNGWEVFRDQTCPRWSEPSPICAHRG